MKSKYKINVMDNSCFQIVSHYEGTYPLTKGISRDNIGLAKKWNDYSGNVMCGLTVSVGVRGNHSLESLNPACREDI